MLWIILFAIIVIIVFFVNKKAIKKNPNSLPPTPTANFDIEKPIFSLPRTSVTIVFTQIKKYGMSWPFASFTLYDKGLVAKAGKEVKVSYKDIDHMKLRGLILTLYFKTESPIQILIQSRKAKEVAKIIKSKGIALQQK